MTNHAQGVFVEFNGVCPLLPHGTRHERMANAYCDVHAYTPIPWRFDCGEPSMKETHARTHP